MKIYEMFYQLSVQNNRRWFPSYTKGDLNFWNSFIKTDVSWVRRASKVQNAITAVKTQFLKARKIQKEQQ